MCFGVEEKNILLSECVGVVIAEGVRKREKSLSNDVEMKNIKKRKQFYYTF